MAKKTDLIGYCGIYCATCPGYTQSVANLAKDLGKELHQYKFDKCADFLAKMPGLEAFKNYEKGCELLKAMAALRCPGCRDGGGGPDCKIRICAKQKGFAGCWQCSELKTCKNFKLLEQSGDKTYIKNLRIIRKSGPAAFVKKVSKRT
ncbi:MAG: DUF3795 domain-containing protein [Sedimentisphaerales bacterium]